MPRKSPTRSPRHRPRSRFLVVPLSDSPVTIEFGNEITPESNTRVIALARTISEQQWQGLHDVVPTYRSITIHFDLVQWDSAVLIMQLKALPRPRPRQASSHGTLHEIPILYGVNGGPISYDNAAPFLIPCFH